LGKGGVKKKNMGKGKRNPCDKSEKEVNNNVMERKMREENGGGLSKEKRTPYIVLNRGFVKNGDKKHDR